MAINITKFHFDSDIILVRFKKRPCTNYDFGDLFFFKEPYEFHYEFDGDPKNVKRFVIPPFLGMEKPDFDSGLLECKSTESEIHTDFSSVPWVFRWLISRTGAYTEASIAHDYLYMLRHEYVQKRTREFIAAHNNRYQGYCSEEVGREEADQAFFRGLIDSEVHDVRYRLIKLAIKLGGQRVYGDKTLKRNENEDVLARKRRIGRYAFTGVLLSGVVTPIAWVVTALA